MTNREESILFHVRILFKAVCEIFFGTLFKIQQVVSITGVSEGESSSANSCRPQAGGAGREADRKSG